jgi:hypothetical protein
VTGKKSSRVGCASGLKNPANLGNNRVAFFDLGFDTNLHVID